MKRLLFVVAVLSLALSAVADWDPGMEAKWVQYPDLEPSGIDINTCTPFFLLADDFQCFETGPITDIHIWGSWYQDFIPEPYDVTFTLSIHADIPAEQSPTGYSMPGEVLWLRQFDGPAGEFSVRRYAENIDEGWMEPPDFYEFPGDHICWQYNFFIDEADAFIQEGQPDNPVVYWLDVQATPNNPDTWFGWKTSLDHWNDDAVWGYGPEPYYEPWYELIYPPTHEYAGLSIDLAFVITSATHEEVDWGDAPDGPYPTLAGSLGANHVIVPPTYMGPSIDPEPDGQPDATATGDDNDGNDDEDGVNFTSPLVQGMGATVDVTVNGGGYLSAWFDWEQDGSWSGNQVFTDVWLNVGTTTLTYTVPASAVPGLTFARFRFSTVTGLSETGSAPDGEVEDYEVPVEEGETYKWIQYPDLEPTGIDVNDTEPYILADDFECRAPGRLTEIYVWGSWLGDYIPYQEDPSAVVFTLSIHEDIPADESPTGYSMPGEVLWFQDFQPGSFFVDLWQDGLEEGWMDPPDGYFWPGDTACWLYTFLIPPDLAFHQVGMPDEPIVYWLDVQARPLDVDARFGWKTSVDHWNDDAVFGFGAEPYPGPWEELFYPPTHLWEGISIDLAFAVRSTYGTGTDDSDVPLRFGLEQNVPNPFNPKTTIRYEVPSGGSQVAIEVFDASGRLVRNLVDGFQDEGRREIVWDGSDNDGHSLPSGVYFYRLVTSETELTRKMLLLK